MSFNRGVSYVTGSPPLKFQLFMLHLSYLSPRGGPSNGGTMITVAGTGFALLGDPYAVRGRLQYQADGGEDNGGDGSSGGSSDIDGDHVSLGGAASLRTSSVIFVTPSATSARPIARVGRTTVSVAINAAHAFDGTPADDASGRHAGDYTTGSGSGISFTLFDPPTVRVLSPKVRPVRGGTLTQTHTRTPTR